MIAVHCQPSVLAAVTFFFSSGADQQRRGVGEGDTAVCGLTVCLWVHRWHLGAAYVLLCVHVLEFSLSDLFFPFCLCAVGGEIPLDMRLGGGQLVSEELMNLGESFTQTNDPSLKLFQCAVCNKFTTDNLDMLGLHMNVERSLPEDEWKAVMGDSYQCKLCRYNTQLKANFQLHCKTDKHVQKYQLVAHIKEGGKANEWRLKCVAIGNPVHLKCNACDYYTNSLEKLRLHTVNSRHEASLKLYKVRVGFASSSFVFQGNSKLNHNAL